MLPSDMMTGAEGENKPKLTQALFRPIRAVDFVMFVIIDLGISRLTREHDCVHGDRVRSTVLQEISLQGT